MQPEAQQGDAEQIPQPVRRRVRLLLGRRRCASVAHASATGNQQRYARRTFHPARQEHCGFEFSVYGDKRQIQPARPRAPTLPRYQARLLQRRLTSRPRRPQHPRLPRKKLSMKNQPRWSRNRLPRKPRQLPKTADDSLGAAPVVLVPPADPAEGGQIASAPIVVDQPVATQPAPVVKKKKTLLGLFRGTNDDVARSRKSPPPPLNSKLLPFPKPHQFSSRPHLPRLQAAAADILSSSPHSNRRPKPAPSLAG